MLLAAIAAAPFTTTAAVPVVTTVSILVVTLVSASGSARCGHDRTRAWPPYLGGRDGAARAAASGTPLLGRVSSGPVPVGGAEARIGGDLYEAVNTAHGVRLLIGDVRGKGLLAVETAAAMLAAFREAAYEVYTLAEVARRINAEDLARPPRGTT